MTIHYDDPAIYDDILLDLPVREGTGLITHDVSKAHRPVTMHNTPTWTEITSGLVVPTHDGEDQYMRILAANSTELNFTSGDYTIAGWIYLASGGSSMSQELISRFELSVSGWELYSYTNGLITMRHNHGGTPLRTGFYSAAWAFDTWYFLMVTRHLTSGQFYRDGLPVTTVSDVLVDPGTCNKNLYIGAGAVGASNFHKGMWYRWRVWPSAKTAAQAGQIYEKEKYRFA